MPLTAPETRYLCLEHAKLAQDAGLITTEVRIAVPTCIAVPRMSLKRQALSTPKCTTPDCTARSLKFGLCSACYNKEKYCAKHGSDRELRTCATENCERVALISQTICRSCATRRVWARRKETT